MKEKKPFVATKNHFYVFFGLFLCLFSVILILNTGVVARVLSTPFTYLFGSLSYVLYFFIMIIGLRLMIAKKFTKIRFNSYFFASIIMSIAVMMFFAHFVIVNEFKGTVIGLTTDASAGTTSFMDAYSGVFKAVDGGYMNTPSLMLFSHPFASGFLGYFFVGAFNGLFNFDKGGLIFAIVIAVIALFIYSFPLILRLTSHNK